jgi:hypothetical protein
VTEENWEFIHGDWTPEGFEYWLFKRRYIK